MHLLLVNPNTTASMTAAIAATAKAAARPDTVVEAVNPRVGPISIENDHDEQRSIPKLLAELRAGDARPAATRPDADVVAASVIRDSTKPATWSTPRQAAIQAAALTTGSYSVVTSMSATVWRSWQLAETYTPAECLGVHACDIPVLRIGSDPATIEPIGELCRQARELDQSRSIVLGCAAMARFAEPLAVRLGVPVIDGVVAAPLLAEAVVALPTFSRLRTRPPDVRSSRWWRVARGW